MPAPSRTWTISLNNAPSDQSTIEAQNREIILALKDEYISAGWTVVGSTDGTDSDWDATSPYAATDYWGVVGDLNWEANGNAHSYIVLASQVGYPSASKRVYLTITLSTGAANQQDVTFHWASAIPTENGTPLVNDPTQPANSRAFTNTQVVPSPVANCKYHMHRNTDGDVMFLVSEDGSSRAAFCCGSLEAINGDTGTNYPWIGLCIYDDAGPGALEEDNWRAIGSMAMFWQDDTLLTATNQMGICQYYLSSSNYQDQMDQSGSDISTEFFDLPAILVTRNTLKVAVYGVLPDVSCAPTHTAVVQGTEKPTGTANVALWGHFWLPNDNVTPQL